MTLKERVDAGIAWLDSRYPDWAANINGWFLDMGDGEQCILGQLGRTVARTEVARVKQDMGLGCLSTYTVMCDLNGLDYTQPAALGFGLEDDEPAIALTRLELLWTSEVFARQSRSFHGIV